MTIYPFYRVYTEKGEQYCDCGWEKHAQELIILNKDVQPLTYRRIDAPKPINPETVDVSVTPTEELPGQQGLQKQLTDFLLNLNLKNYHKANLIHYDCRHQKVS